jgi:protein-S-isoprenylcysteine O-methyltransferase Ste14
MEAQMKLLKWIDIPPVWLTAFAMAAYFQAQYFSLGLSLDFAVTRFVAGLLLGGGVLLGLLAVYEMRRQDTTIIPHREADRLVQSGIFSRMRNPIYLGDLLILAGITLYFDAVLALVLVPVLARVLERRFILPEEDRLRRKFRADFALYCQKTRRWI